METCPLFPMFIETERLLLFLRCFLQHNFAGTLTFPCNLLHSQLKDTKHLRQAQRSCSWALTEEGLQADHAGHEAVKVNGQLGAAGVAGNDAVLHLLVEPET